MARTTSRSGPRPTRHAGRIAALQALYGLDVRGLLAGEPSTEVVDEALVRQFAALDAVDDEVRRFAAELCHGVVQQRARLDALLGRCADNWRVERMSYVDRNVLRLAAFELSGRSVPAGAAINEAVELGKAFGTTESGGFINGVLDRVARDLEL